MKEAIIKFFSNEIELEKINWKNDTIKIVKIHGCISNQKEMAITLESVARKTINEHKNKIVSSFFSRSINRYVAPYTHLVYPQFA